MGSVPGRVSLGGVQGGSGVGASAPVVGRSGAELCRVTAGFMCWAVGVAGRWKRTGQKRVMKEGLPMDGKHMRGLEGRGALA